MDKGRIVVLGLGEVGKPLRDLISQHGAVDGFDVEGPRGDLGAVDVMHVCYPYQIPDFVGETARYIELLKPRLTVVNSTVGVGTTAAISRRTGAAVAYSPVRGKHARMLEDMKRYVKFVGSSDRKVAEQAARHFESVGLKTKVLSSAEAAEVAKLTETTFFGLMIAWAQEVERYTDKVGVDYNEVVSFYEEIGFFPPVKYFPGVIGGHCVMPNIEILSRFVDSDILKAIQSSNSSKIERDAAVAAR